jgi:hypothetical protein
MGKLINVVPGDDMLLFSHQCQLVAPMSQCSGSLAFVNRPSLGQVIRIFGGIDQLLSYK